MAVGGRGEIGGLAQHLNRANPTGKSPGHYGVSVLAPAASRTPRPHEDPSGLLCPAGQAVGLDAP
eukprot:1859389-Pyramimonas_sp.AAC.1